MTRFDAGQVWKTARARKQNDADVRRCSLGTFCFDWAGRNFATVRLD